MTMRRVLFGVVAALPLCGPAASAATLDAHGIRNLISGTTVETWDARREVPLFITFATDGALSGRRELAMRTITDEGKWWTASTGEGRDLLCWQWQRWGQARRHCVTLVRDGKLLVRWRARDNEPITGQDWKISKEGPRTAEVASTPAAGAGPAARPAARPQVASPSPMPAPSPAPVARRDTAPPAIELPTALTASGAVVEIEGRVQDSSRVVEVTVDRVPVALGADGALHIRRGVPQGESTITVAAMDEWGNRSSRQVTVTRPVAARPAAPLRPPVAPQQALAAPAASAPAAAVPGDIDFGRYRAVVIGNNKYRRMTSLKTAVNDARAVAGLLKDEYGFEVELLINATRSDVIGALTRLRAKLTPADNLLIYYAGHGVLDALAEQGYWLPVDADVDVPTNWISTSDITVMVRAIRARHITVVADSCYSGTLVRSAPAKLKTGRQRDAWLRRMAKKRARTALVSGGLEPVLDGGGGGHSVFAKAFIDALRENRGVLDGQALFDIIKRPIVVNSDQTPEYSDIRNAGHDGGDFLFVRRLQTTAAP